MAEKNSGMLVKALGCLTVLVIFVAFGYGMWRLERWINYKWNYQDLVQGELEPLKSEVKELRARIEALENAKKTPEANPTPKTGDPVRKG